MGRPKIPIDEQQVRALASIQCTYPEMSAVLGASEDTLRARFSGIIKEGKAGGHMSLRRLQWAKAKEGSVAMLIWLGKQWLGQRDRSEIEAVVDAAPIAFEVAMERVRNNLGIKPRLDDVVVEGGNGNGESDETHN